MHGWMGNGQEMKMHVPLVKMENIRYVITIMRETATEPKMRRLYVDIARGHLLYLGKAIQHIMHYVPNQFSTTAMR